jgi:hypothetical protein
MTLDPDAVAARIAEMRADAKLVCGLGCAGGRSAHRNSCVVCQAEYRIIGALASTADMLEALMAEVEYWKAVAIRFQGDAAKARDEVTRCSKIALENARRQDELLDENERLRAAQPNWDLQQMTAQRDALLQQTVEQSAELRRMRLVVEAAERMLPDWDDTSGSMSRIDAMNDHCEAIAKAVRASKEGS